MERDVPQADSRKPDPDEPFRYVCPDCRGQVHGQLRTMGEFRCSTCDKTWEMDDLYDQKFSVAVGQRALSADD